MPCDNLRGDYILTGIWHERCSKGFQYGLRIPNQPNLKPRGRTTANIKDWGKTTMKKLVKYLTLGMLALMAPGAAMALTVAEFNAAYSGFNFGVVGSGNSNAGDLANLSFGLSLVTDGTTVTMTYSNNSAISSVIAQIYVDDSGEALLGTPTILSPVVNNQLKFVVGSGAPANMPGGNNIGFSANTALSVYAANPAPKNGIGQGESLVLQYTLLSDLGTLSDALQDGTLRFGMHVQSIGTAGNSDAFVGTPNELPPPPPPLDPVPEPATMVLFGLGAGMLAARKRLGGQK